MLRTSLRSVVDMGYRLTAVLFLSSNAQDFIEENPSRS